MAVSKSNYKWWDQVCWYIKYKSGIVNIPEPYTIAAAHIAISVVVSIYSGKPSCAVIYCSGIPLSHMCWFLPRTFRHCLIYCCNLSHMRCSIQGIYIYLLFSSTTCPRRVMTMEGYGCMCITTYSLSPLCTTVLTSIDTTNEQSSSCARYLSFLQLHLKIHSGGLHWSSMKSSCISTA